MGEGKGVFSFAPLILPPSLLNLKNELEYPSQTFKPPHFIPLKIKSLDVYERILTFMM